MRGEVRLEVNAQVGTQYKGSHEPWQVGILVLVIFLVNKYEFNQGQVWYHRILNQSGFGGDGDGGKRFSNAAEMIFIYG